MLFEPWKYKLGSRERGNCVDRIAESLNQCINVSQKSIRDSLVGENSDETVEEKASAEEMRIKAMERLGETKKRAADHQPRKKRKHTRRRNVS